MRIIVAAAQTPSPAADVTIWSALVKNGHALPCMLHDSLCKVLESFMTLYMCYTISQASLLLAFTEVIKVNTNLPIPGDKC